VAILLWWLLGTESAPRRATGATLGAPVPETTAVEAAPDQPAVVPSEILSLRREPSPAPILEGTVVDPDGRGVEGVSLTAAFARNGSSCYPHHLGSEACRTDDAGRFRMDVPWRAEWAQLRIDAPGWVEPTGRTVSAGGTKLADGEPVDARALGLVRGDDWPRQRIVLERGRPIEGVVETAEGIPVPDARVEATWAPGRTSACRTDDRGHFSILVPAAATLRARATHGDLVTPEGSPPWPGSDAVRPRFEGIIAGDAEASTGPCAPGARDLLLVLRETHELGMRVLGPDGPFTGPALVRVRNRAPLGSWVTYEPYVREGALEYRVPCVTPGIYEIEVLPRFDLQPARIVATVPGEPIEVRCKQPLQIEGLLEGDDLNDFEITWTGPGNAYFDEGQRQRGRTLFVSTPDFVLRGVGDGAGDLYARREGDPRCALVTGCRPGRGVVRMTLSEGHTISGRVDVPEGLDPSALAVRAVHGRLDQYARVGPDGTFSTVGLPPGVFRVELVARAWTRDVRWLHDACDRVPAGADGVRLRVRLPGTDPGPAGG